MKRRWTLAEVARATGGEAIGELDVAIGAVTTDSRNVTAGSLFVAIRGETFDGHDFVGEAITAGAAAAVVESGEADLEPRIEVADSVTALRDLAAAVRAEQSVVTVAVTGSTGKTTTKDLLATALPESFASPRSFNNEIGVPLTVLRAPDDIKHLVIEVGSRGLGDIRWLAPAVQPDVAVITNLGLVHLETFGTEDDLAAAKFELVETLDGSGVAVLPSDEPRLNRPHMGRTITFGSEVTADVAVSELRLNDELHPVFKLDTPEGSAEVEVPLPGRHQALNAAAAIAAGIGAEVPLGVLVEGLTHVAPSRWRMDVVPGRYTVVNDAYNANPDSVEAALRTVAEMPGRHIAVLGLMAELGPVAEREHRRIGELVAELGFAAVVVIGDEPGMAEAAGPIARAVADPDAAQALLADILRAGDVVLVKASRAVGLETLAEALIEGARR